MNEIDNALYEEIVADEESELSEISQNEALNEDNDELLLLGKEVEELRKELKMRNEREEANSRFLKEIKEFEEYFPEVDLHQIPSEIWEQVKGGASLSATFALNLKKLEAERKKANDFNEKNRRMSAGSLMQDEGEKYYSPSEVKKMTLAQVKLHYDDIVESMRHWN